MTATETEVQRMESPLRVLNANDRCDRCGAQAYFAAKLPSAAEVPNPGELLLCGHHGEEHLASLMAAGAEIIVDNRHALSAR